MSSAKAIKTQGLFPKASSTTNEFLKEITTSEIVIGLCGPIGAPLPETIRNLKQVLEENYHFEVVEIILSDQIKKITGKKYSASGFSRYDDLINDGNNLRQQHGDSILAEAAIRTISMHRHAKNTSEGLDGQPKKFKASRTAYLIRSIKNKQEYEILRNIYSDSFFLLGVSSRTDDRIARLEKNPMSTAEIYSLIDRDSGEESRHGQSVRDTFPLSDYFIIFKSDRANEMKNKVERFLNLVFGTEFETPLFPEHAMFTAYNAGLNSACLSRQVGAALVDLDAKINLSIGWNEVPKSGGGVYFNGHADDSRCFNKTKRHCHNDHEKRAIIDEIIEELSKGKCIDESERANAKAILEKSRIKQLLEFSRAVHAEMHAIINHMHTKQHTSSNLALFVTTYPCHNCARHLVASGIKTVYYIEPYRKSLATKLHEDSVEETYGIEDSKKMQLIQYEGVAPSRYEAYFLAKKRKDEQGKLIAGLKESSSPVTPFKLQSIPIIEEIIVKKLAENKVFQYET